VDGGPARPIGTSAVITVPDLEVGSHTVQLNVSPGCTVEGDNPRSVSVEAGSTVMVAFIISCEPPAPALAMIAFEGYTSTGITGIFVVNPDGTGLENLSPDAGSPVWSPDGRRLLVRSLMEIAVLNADGSDRRQVAGGVITAGHGWSPDGSMIAYVVQHFEEDWLAEDLWVAGADGQSRAMLAEDALQPTWSPDGQRIAFARFSREEELDIRVINVDGTGERALTDPGLSAYEPAWSPDGERIAFTSLGHPGIYTVSPEGTDLQRLSPENARDEGAVWSPDGSMLAFVSYPDQQSPRSGIGVMNRDGSSRQILTTLPGLNAEPDWSPDGSSIVFSNRIQGAGQSEIYVINADGSGLRNVSNMPGTYDLAPDWGP
jgi:TolB protein